MTLDELIEKFHYLKKDQKGKCILVYKTSERLEPIEYISVIRYDDKDYIMIQ